QRVVDAHYPSGTGEPVVVISKADSASQVQQTFQNTPGVAPGTVTVAPPQNGLAYLQGTLTDAPDTQAAKDTVDRVRASVHQIEGADAKVGGNTAVQLDVY